MSVRSLVCATAEKGREPTLREICSAIVVVATERAEESLCVRHLEEIAGIRLPTRLLQG